MESKGKRESCIQPNAEFQRITRRDKKDFFNEQCLKIEENNRRGKARGLFRRNGEALYGQQKQDLELTVAQIISFL